MPRGKPATGTYGGVNCGSDYTYEELQFLRALTQYKQQHHKPFPSWREILDILKDLGWRPPQRAG